MKRLKKELTCIDKNDRRLNDKIDIKSFVNDIPNSISDSDFRDGQYKFDGFTEFKYPEDYQKLNTNKDDKALEMKIIQIKTSEKFSIESSINFDFPYSLFDMNIFDNIKSDDNDPNSLPNDYQLVAS